jgi:hypothetical protein
LAQDEAPAAVIDPDDGTGPVEPEPVERHEAPGTGPAPLREPPPVRESIVIPVVTGAGHSTVDLTVDQGDLAEIRAAQREESTGEDTSEPLG